MARVDPSRDGDSDGALTSQLQHKLTEGGLRSKEARKGPGITHRAGKAAAAPGGHLTMPLPPQEEHTADGALPVPSQFGQVCAQHRRESESRKPQGRGR